MTHPDNASIVPEEEEAVTSVTLVIDGDRDKEVVEFDPITGASSDAAPNSGIPSAKTQRQGQSGATDVQSATRLGGHKIPIRQDTKP